jgi:NADH dehydrogenase (ubiquinone) 1 alpha subcomplex subunit 9
MSEYPILYKLNAGRTRILPVHVLDVAQALGIMLTAPLTSTSSTFALPGPAIHTYNSLLNLVAAMTMNPASTAPTVPKALAKAFATISNRALWWPTVNADDIERKYIDDFGVDLMEAAAAEQKPSGWAANEGNAKMVGIDGEAIKSWADLDMEPDHVEEHAIKFLRRYRAA